MGSQSGHRRFPRYPIQFPLLYKPTTSAPIRFGVGWTRDLSEGGVCAELDERLDRHALLRLRLQTNRGPVELDAEVMWAGESRPAGGGVRHGLAFAQIGSEQVEALRDLLLPFRFVPHAGVRLSIEVPAMCQRKDQQGSPLKGVTGDISRDGLLLLLPEALPPGSSLEVTLQTPKGPLRLEGFIVWVEPPERRRAGNSIRHGLQFTSLTWSISLALGLLMAEPP